MHVMIVINLELEPEKVRMDEPDEPPCYASVPAPSFIHRNVTLTLRSLGSVVALFPLSSNTMS